MIEIALASDANYVCGLLVTAASLARHADPSAEIRFNVLDGGIADSTWDDFVARVTKEHEKTSFRRFTVDDKRFAAFPEWNGKSRLTYARLLLPGLLPDTDFVIYCDVDFLWSADVAELWSLRNPRAIVQSTPDGSEETRTHEAPWFAERGLIYSFDRYFCAGLCFCNLKLWRECKVAEKALAFLDAHTDVHFADQSALNAILGGEPLAEGIVNVATLPAKWQKMSRFTTTADIEKGCVIHYAGDTPWGRGWRTQPLTDLNLLWHVFNGSLTGCDELASLHRFFDPGDVRRRRVLFALFTMPILRDLLFALFRLTGRAGYLAWLRPCCRRLPWRRLAQVILSGKGGAA